MSLPSKDLRAGAAATRRSSRRIIAANLPSEPGTPSSVFIALPEVPSTRLTRAMATSTSSLEQAPARPSKSTISAQSDSVQPRRNGPKNSPRKQEKLKGPTNRIDEDALNFILRPIRAKERETWKGWCEVESEPVGLSLQSCLSSSFIRNTFYSPPIHRVVMSGPEYMYLIYYAGFLQRHAS